MIKYFFNDSRLQQHCLTVFTGQLNHMGKMVTIPGVYHSKLSLGLLDFQNLRVMQIIQGFLTPSVILHISSKTGWSI